MLKQFEDMVRLAAQANEIKAVAVNREMTEVNYLADQMQAALGIGSSCSI